MHQKIQLGKTLVPLGVAHVGKNGNFFMPKKGGTEQRQMFNLQPSLLEEQEEEVNDRSRRFLNRLKQARRIFQAKAAKENPDK